jgi:hypothetical protein
LESYFRHRILYLLPIGLLAVAGFVRILTAERNYIAWGIIYVQKDSFLGNLTDVRDVPFTFRTPAQETASQIMDLVQTNAFIRSVIQDTDLEAEMSLGESVVNDVMAEVRTAIWTQTIGDNQVAIFSAHSDPELAFDLSNAVINRYIQWQINLDKVQSGAAEAFMDELVVTYSRDVESARENLRQYLETHPEPLRGERPDLEVLEIDRLRGLLNLAGQRYSRALEQQEGAKLATAQAEADVRQTFFVVDAPYVPAQPAVSRRDLALEGLVFAAIGVILAAVAIAGGALLDRSFRFPMDVEYGLALPVLSMVPDSRPKQPLAIRLRRTSKAAVTEKRNRKISGSLADDEVVEATI